MLLGISTKFLQSHSKDYHLERPGFLLEFLPAPASSHQLGKDGEVALELMRKTKVERGEVCEAGDAEVEVDDMESVRRKDLTEESSLADAESRISNDLWPILSDGRTWKHRKVR